MPPFTGVAVNVMFVLKHNVPVGEEVTETEGVTGVLTVTAKVRAVDEPHALLAVTETFPLEPADTATIEVLVDEPVHPPGKVHV